MTSLEYSYIPFIELPENIALKISELEDRINGRLKNKDISEIQNLQSQIYDWTNNSIYFVYKTVVDYIERSLHELSRYDGEFKQELLSQLEELETSKDLLLESITSIQDGHLDLSRFISEFKENSTNNILKKFLRDESAQVVRRQLHSLAKLSSSCLRYVENLCDEMKISKVS